MSDGPRHRAYLALGSNIAPETNLPAAVRELAQFGTVLAASRVWESAPVGFREQANFLNAAVLLETALDPNQLRNEAFVAIEQKLNRVRDPNNVNAPRTIDIDLTLYDRDVFQIGTRRVPDPDLLTRSFVAVPIAELDPAYIHPEVSRTLADIAGDFRNVQPPLIARPDVDLLHDINLANNKNRPVSTGPREKTL